MWGAAPHQSVLSNPFRVELKMSNQQKKPETKAEQKTDATAMLSPEELRAISGGGGTGLTPPPSTPPPGSPTGPAPTGG
jgi:hypothetical protein